MENNSFPSFHYNGYNATDLPNVTSLTTAEDEPYWPLPFRIVMSVFLCLFIIFAVFGNLMVVLVIARHQGMQTRTNLFLCNLALADILCGVIDMPVTLATLIAGRWVFPDWLCQFNGFTLPLLFIASIHTLMYISIHKYVSITRPFSVFLTRNRVVGMILAAWVWALLSGYLTIHGLNHVYYKPYTTQCGPEYPHDFRTYSHVIFITVTGYFIPLLIMVFCFGGIFKELNAHAARMRRHTTMRKKDIYSQQRRITSTLLGVLVMFGLSWLPYIIYSFYMTINHNNDVDKVPARANPFSYICVYINSAFNPVIYVKGSSAFREGFKEILCCWKNKAVKDEDSLSLTAFHRFKTYVRETLHATFNSSSDVNSQSTLGRASISNLTNNVLFHKRRALSTCSLPQNFHYSVHSANRRVVFRPRKMSIPRISKWISKVRFGKSRKEENMFPPTVQARLLQAPIGYCAREEAVIPVPDTDSDSSIGGLEEDCEIRHQNIPNVVVNRYITEEAKNPLKTCRSSFPAADSSSVPSLLQAGRRKMSLSQGNCSTRESPSSIPGNDLKHSVSEPNILDSELDKRGMFKPALRLKAIRRLLKKNISSQSSLESKASGGASSMHSISSSHKTDRQDSAGSHRKSPFEIIQSWRKSKPDPFKLNVEANKTKLKTKSLPRPFANGSTMKRRNTAKAKLYRCPSIEKLDIVEIRQRTYTDIPTTKLRPKRRSGKTSFITPDLKTLDSVSDKPNLKLNLPSADDYLHIENDEIIVQGRVRSGSDPCVTFKMIEEKVLSRKRTKQWKKDERRKTTVRDHSRVSTEGKKTNNMLTSIPKALSFDLPDIRISREETTGVNCEHLLPRQSNVFEDDSPGHTLNKDTRASDVSSDICERTRSTPEYGLVFTSSSSTASRPGSADDLHGLNDTQAGISGHACDSPVFDEDREAAADSMLCHQPRPSQLLTMDPHKRCIFTGYYSGGDGPDRETVL